MALPYFAILNSKIGGGQTLGKKWMHLQVVDKDGNTIPFGSSVLRYAVLAIPYYLDEIRLPVTRTPWFISSLVSVVITGVGAATLYLVLFNRHTRQGVHDLAVKSYVADADMSGPLKTKAIWKIHWVILSSLLILLFVGGGIFSNKLSRWGNFPRMLDDVRLIERMPSVQAAGVQDMYWSCLDNGEKKRILIVTIFWTGKPEAREAFANQVVKTILQADSTIERHDSLRVVIIRGYNLGIAHAQVSYPFEHTPAQWRVLVFGTSPPEAPGLSKL